MIYNLDNPLDKESFLARASFLASKGGAVELTSKRPYSERSNNYLHAIISYFALQYGETAEYTKQKVFKEIVNPEVFAIWRENEIRGKYQTWRSTSSLTKDEMSLCIDRFRDYSSKEFGVYLPSPDDYTSMQQIEIIIQQNKKYL